MSRRGRISLLCLSLALLGSLGATPQRAQANHYDHLLAPPGRCANDTNAAAPADAQRGAMRCLANYARCATGAVPLASGELVRVSSGPLPPAAPTRYCTSNFIPVFAWSTLSWRAVDSPLRFSAQRKAEDILACGVFSHQACGRPTEYWIRASGYLVGCHGWAENLGWGSGFLAAARPRMSGWLHSDGHRRNLLNPDHRDHGVGLAQGRFLGWAGAQVWTSHLGYHPTSFPPGPPRCG